MSRRERASTQQAIAVALALLMLLSMGSMAFVGGAGAQATGGTYDQVFDQDQQRDVSDDLNTDQTVQLAGPANDVDLASAPNNDGRVLVSGDGSQGTFRGLTLSPERIAATTNASSPTDEALATFLDDEVPAEFNVSTNQTAGTAIPAVFIEFDPQSEFSQIQGVNRNVNGTHDFIVVAPANASTNPLGNSEQLNGTVDTNLNATDNTDIDQGDIVALSVDNDQVASGGANSTLLASESDFGTVFDTLVGSSETNLQDKNVDQVQFAAGTFDQPTPVAITEVQLADDIANDFATGETIHSDKIVLNDGDRRFSSISDAVTNASDEDSITVDRGNYSALEGQNVTVDTDVAIGTTSRVNSGSTIDRVDTENTTIDDPANEAIINTSVEVQNSSTISGVVVENGTTTAVNVTDSGAELNNVIVNHTATNTAVNASVSGVTVTGSTLMANNATLFEAGEVGLELNGTSGANVASNFFVGFETQVANISDTGSADALFTANENEFDDPRTQSAVPFSDGSVNATSLFGAINASDSAAADGDTIQVTAGTYNEGASVVVATDDIAVDGAGDTTSIENPVSFTGSTAATLTDAEVDPGQSGVDAVNATGTDPNVTVERVSIPNLNQGTGVNIDDAGAVVDVRDVTVNADDTTADGVNITGVSTGSDVDVERNTLTGLENGTALVLNEDPAGGEADRFNIDENELRGGSAFTGIEYNLDNTTGTNITANTIVGADVTGNSTSVGINFINVTVTEGDAGGITGPEITEANALTIRDNVLNGHARIINSQDQEVLSTDYTNILDLGSNEELNNTVGTVVIGPDGETFQETYGDRGEISLAGPTDTYLPGSVNESARLIDAGPSDTAEVEVQNIGGVTGPDTYEDETVSLPDIDGLTISGEGTDTTPTVESRVVIDQSDAINNHTVRNLAINNTDASEPAVNLTNGHNSQSTFDNLAVTSAQSGIVVDATETDVNVIEIRNSDFEVQADGIVLSAEPDDRDGFVVTDNTVTGPGISTASTGLNLSEVDKPGKDGLETNLTVTDNTISDFERQVDGNASTPITALNFTARVDDEVSATNFSTDDRPSVDISGNEFGQQVLVFTAAGEPQNASAENVSLRDPDVYGSIDTAQGVSLSDGDVVRVYDVDEFYSTDGTPTTYAENVTVDHGTANVTIRGPAFNDSADASSFRSADALIRGTVEFGNLGGVGNEEDVFTGFTVVADDTAAAGSVVNVTTNPGNLTIENTGVSALGNQSNDGIPDQTVDGITIETEAGNSPPESVVLTNVFVGDHDAANTTNSSVVVDAPTELEIEDSEFTSRTDVLGTGLNYTSAAGNTTVTGTDIRTHGTDGINASSNLVNISVADSTIADNNADGVFMDNSGTLTVVNTAVTGHDTGTGIELQATDSASTINVSVITGNDVGLLANGSDDPGVTGNTFANGANGGLDIDTTDSATLNASRNFFNSPNGPEGDAAAGVNSTVAYDPFLTTDQASDTIDDVTTTAEFGHDVIVPAGEVRAVGFPGQMDSDRTFSVADALGTSSFSGNVFGFENGEFTTVDPATTEIDDFDAFVIENTGDESVAVAIEYDAGSPAREGIATRELDSGFNFVAAPVAGQVNATFYEAAEDTQKNDFILEPFGLGENLYGSGSQSAAQFGTTPDENFRSGFGAGGAAGQQLHPHGGYLVFVQDQSNGVVVVEQIGPGVTADEVEQRTNQTAS